MIPDTIEIKIDEPLKHSKLGIAACVIAVLVYIYFFAAGYISILVLEDFFKDSNSIAVLGIAVIAFFLHLAICSVGFIVGVTFSIVGLITKDRKRLFPVIGLILNFLPLISAIGFTIYFFWGVKSS